MKLEWMGGGGNIYHRASVAGLFALALGASADPASASGSFTLPQTTAGEDGWHLYVDAPMVDRALAQALDPGADSPEAAVVLFLASRARGDAAWTGAMTSTPSGRTSRALAEWAAWQLERFQLRGRQDVAPDATRIRVFFEVSIGGAKEEGEDEFDVVREGDGWRITHPPA